MRLRSQDHWYRPLPGRADRPAPAHRPPVLRRSPKQSGRQLHREWGANLSSPTPSDENGGLDANRREEVVAKQGRGELVERPLAPFALTDALWIVTATDPGGISEPVRKRLAVIEPLGPSLPRAVEGHVASGRGSSSPSSFLSRQPRPPPPSSGDGEIDPEHPNCPLCGAAAGQRVTLINAIGGMRDRCPTCREFIGTNAEEELMRGIRDIR